MIRQSSRLGDVFVVHRDGIDLDCEVVATGATHLFDPYTAHPLPSSLQEGEGRQPAKSTSGRRMGVQVSQMRMVPGSAPMSWSQG